MSSLSGIRRMMAGLRHDYFGRVNVHMLKAFVDDSGSGGDSPWFVLAGYIGTVEGWDRFDGEWQKVLDGPPCIEYFKASEAESLRPDGQWAGICKEQRNERIDELIRVIGRCSTRAFYVRTKTQDYNEVIKPYIPPQWDNPYYFLFMGSIAAATSVEKHDGMGEPIEFVFDHGCKKRIERPSLSLYGQVAHLPQFKGRVANIHYEDEKLFVPLQAADLLAWQIRRRFCEDREVPRPQFESALNAPPDREFHHTITREGLERLGVVMDEDGKQQWELIGMPEELRPWKRPPNEKE